MTTERRRDGLPGWLVLITALLLAVIAAMFVIAAVRSPGVLAWTVAIVLIAAVLAVLPGFFIVELNQAKVLQLFGRYAGTARTTGLRWANPLLKKKPISLRVRHLETPTLKVSDDQGNPIEAGAVIVWRIADTARATFETDQYEKYVAFQSEAALRGLAVALPRDVPEAAEGLTLGNRTEEVGERLRVEIQKRLEKSGIHVMEARVSHLAYAPEVAAAMLHAGAFLAARQRIVDGAVGLVDHALKQIEERGVVQLDEKDRATLATNLLVALCSDQHSQPGVRTGGGKPSTL